MTIIVLIILALVLTAFVIFGKPNLIMAIMCAGIWFVLLWFNLNNPLGGMPLASQGGNALVVVLLVGIVAPLIITLMRLSNDKKQTRLALYDKHIKEGNLSDIETISRGRTNDVDELTPSEYKTLIHSKLHRRR